MQPCTPDDTTNSFFRQFRSAEITDKSNNSFFRQFNSAELIVPNYASIHDASVVPTPTKFPQNSTKIPHNHRTAITTVLCNTRPHTTRASIPQNAKNCNSRVPVQFHLSQFLAFFQESQKTIIFFTMTHMLKSSKKLLLYKI